MENGGAEVNRGSVAVEQLEADIRVLRARRDYHERELQSFRSEIIYFERLLKEKKKQSRWAEGKDGKIQAKAKKKPSKKAVTGVSAEHVGTFFLYKCGSTRIPSVGAARWQPLAILCLL